MNLEEAVEDESKPEGTKPSNSLGIFGESDSGVSGMDKLAGVSVNVEANAPTEVEAPPQSA
ncbi:hypothetical protein J3458_002628 [Metarhizium acridum]|nr:hypothetical protein J3458_002628 [Metarhizium acridum]